MDEAPKVLPAFTVGPLDFYKCNQMPFRLINTSATFQRLMELCLGELQLRWCLIRSFVCNPKRPSVKQSMKWQVSSNLADEPTLADVLPPI